jgi:hypothetical protein
MPAEQRVRRDDRREVMQGRPADSVGAHSESPAVIVSKPQASLTELPPQQAILFNQIGERLPFPAIQPTRDAQEQQPKHRHVDHERQLISGTRQHWPESRRS